MNYENVQSMPDLLRYVHSAEEKHYQECVSRVFKERT